MFNESEEIDYSVAQERHLSTESLALATPLKAQVFLRIRPSFGPVENENHNNIYTVADSSSLFVKQIPLNEASRRMKFAKSSGTMPRKKFTFSKIFNLKTSQSQLFDEAIKPIVIDFLNNQSSTVLNYGTVDAGKTYTLFGSISEPGIIPRAIEFIYSSLSCTLIPKYKPKSFSSVVEIDACYQLFEIEATKKFLFSRLLDKSIYEESYEIIRQSKWNDRVEISKDAIYSIWISFIEIYNETIFDLLKTDEEGKNMQLKLVTDKHGVACIQGVRSVCATTGLEAYQILNAGQMRLTTVSTPNYKSSRSHSIFIIKLLKYEKNSSASDVEVSTISFCDLAGTGKIQKSVENVKEFKESRSINTSLLALGKCLKVIAEGYSRQSIGSFRDSKLTRLFQHSLCGKENIILLINVNPILDLFAETQIVLKFASTAMKLTSEFTKEEKRFSDNHTASSSPKVQGIHSPRDRKTPYENEIDNILLKNKQLLAELRETKSMNLRKEYEVRQELADFYSKQLHELDENWKSRMSVAEQERKDLLRFSVRGVRNYYKGRLENCIDRKCKRIDRGDYEDHPDIEGFDDVDNLSLIFTDLLQENDFVKNDKLLNMQNNQCNLELSLLKKILKKLVESIKNYEEQLKNIRDFKNLDIKNKSILFDKDIKSYLLTISDFIKRTCESDEYFENMKQKKATRTKGTQCTIDYTVFNKFSKEIYELLDTNFIKLPEIDDTLNLSECDQDEDINQLSTLLPKLKELIVENISKIINTEIENNEKSDQMKVLKEIIDQQERDILQLKLQQNETESIRITLEKKIEDLEIKSKSNDFFKNLEYDNINSDPFLDDKAYCKHDISEHDLSPRYSLDDNFGSCLFESESKKNNSVIERSSSDLSKNDSGVASTVDYSTVKVKDQICQTNFFEEDEKLIINYNCTKHPVENLAVLSQELEEIKMELVSLKDSYFTKELIIIEYQSTVDGKNTEINRLNNDKEELSKKCNALMKNLEEVTKEYEKKLTEYQVKVKLHEEEQSRSAKTLEDYWEKSVKLGSQLSFSSSQLENMSIACKEYMIKINELKKELNMKKINENEVIEKIIELEKDHLHINDILEKLNKFEEVLKIVQKEKVDLEQSMHERGKCLLEVEEQSTHLGIKFEECDKQVLSLKSELSIIIRTNLSNRRKVTELGGEVAKLMGKISKMEEDLAKSEKARKDLEQSSNKEISNLRSRLIIFEENSKLLNIICDASDNKLSKVEKLQAKLVEKEKELEFYKKNRNATIQRYECLVGHLQEALKMNENKSSTASKFFSPSQKYFLSNSEENLSDDVIESSSQINNSWISDDNSDTYRLESSNLEHMTYLSPLESIEKSTSKEETDYLILDTNDKSLKTERRKISKNCKAKYSDISALSDSQKSYEKNNFSDRTINR